MNPKLFLFSLIMFTLTSCIVPVDVAPLPSALPTVQSKPTLTASSTFTAVPAETQLAKPLVSSAAGPTQTQLPEPINAISFCDDSSGRELIKSFSAAITSKDGKLLASIISLSSGVDVRYYRGGNVVNYDREHAKFVFETTYKTDWGLSYGSGAPTLGSFQEIILPALTKVFTSKAIIECNQLKVGGVTYQPIWPYPGMNYYSVHFPGTDQYGGLDWQTWAVGMENVADKYFVGALVHYEWEP